MKKALLCLLLFTLMLLGGCASGPAFRTVEQKLQVQPSGKARIYFYRDGTLGGAIQPKILLNGVVVGKSEPKGVFFVDHDPGDMEVVTGSEVEKKLTFTAAAGEVRYVRTYASFGLLVWRIIPELADESKAREAIADLAFTGPTTTEK